MVYITKILGFSIYHISEDEETLCGLDLVERQYENCNILPEDKGFICNKCKRLKEEKHLYFDLDNQKEIDNVRSALKLYGNMRVLFGMANEEQRIIYSLEEALEFSSTYLADSLENPETKFSPSVNSKKLQLTYPLKGEYWNPELSFSMLEYFSAVMKQMTFQSLKGRRN